MNRWILSGCYNLLYIRRQNSSQAILKHFFGTNALLIFSKNSLTCHMTTSCLLVYKAWQIWLHLVWFSKQPLSISHMVHVPLHTCIKSWIHFIFRGHSNFWKSNFSQMPSSMIYLFQLWLRVGFRIHESWVWLIIMTSSIATSKGVLPKRIPAVTPLLVVLFEKTLRYRQ